MLEPWRGKSRNHISTVLVLLVHLLLAIVWQPSTAFKPCSLFHTGSKKRSWFHDNVIFVPQQPLTRHVDRPLYASKRGVEVGIHTAQLLLNPSRHDTLRQQIRRQYPFVPCQVLDACISVTSAALIRLAPCVLQQALLRNGGLERLRPGLQQSIINAGMQHPLLKSLPRQQKRVWITAAVQHLLDYMLQDATFLASPEQQLEALQAEQREIETRMGPWRLLCYKLRRMVSNTILLRTVISVALAVLAAAWAYYYYYFFFQMKQQAHYYHYTSWEYSIRVIKTTGLAVWKSMLSVLAPIRVQDARATLNLVGNAFLEVAVSIEDKLVAAAAYFK